MHPVLPSNFHLGLTRLLDGRRALLVLDGTRLATASLDGTNNLIRGGITVRNLAEDDVLAVEPGGDDGGDEELGAIAAEGVSVECEGRGECEGEGEESLRVRASVGHGQEEGLVVAELEILVGELLAVDGLAAGAL